MRDVSFTDAELLALLPRLRRYALALTRGNRARADDLVQDTVLRSLLYRRQFQAGTCLHKWLNMIMHNVFVDDVRRIVRENAVNLDVVDDLPAVANPEISCYVAEVRDCLAGMRPEHRRLIEAIALTDVSYEDMAALEGGIPIGTVRSRLMRGRVKLRDLAYGVERTEAEVCRDV